MIAASAALVATVGLCVESANIVGYMTSGSPYSGTFSRGGMFIGVNSDYCDIQSIIPQFPADATDAPLDGAYVIQELDDYGTFVQDYYWLLAGSPSATNGEAGWYTYAAGVGYTKAARTFERGEGFIFAAPYYEDTDGNELPVDYQIAGEVKTEAKAVPYEYSGTWSRANYRPIEMSIQKIVPVFPKDATDAPLDGAFVLQELDDYGAFVQDYYYLLEGSPSATNGEAGWYTYAAGVGYTKSDRVFAPGEGFILAAPYYEDADGNELGSALQFME